MAIFGTSVVNHMKFKILLIAFLSYVVNVEAQNIPIDFENNGNGAAWTWAVFENGTNPALEIVDNPDQTGLNKTATVAKFTALQAGQPWVGCESMHGSDIGSWTIDASNAIIRIMVWKSVISDVGIKLVRADNWSLGEIKIANTVVGEWEQLTYDFSAHIGNTYDQIVIFPDFNARTSDQIIYFDEVYGEEAELTDVPQKPSLELKLFPNPTSDLITLESNQNIERVQLFSADGRLIYESKARTIMAQIDLADRSAGLYFLKVNSEGRQEIFRVIKD